MTIAPEQLHRALMIFLEEEIASKAMGLEKFAAYFLLGSLNDHPEKTVGALIDLPLVKMADVVTPDRRINADELFRVARIAMDKAHSISVAGISFSANDIDRLYTILQRG
jgi:hypothetical protein